MGQKLRACRIRRPWEGNYQEIAREETYQGLINKDVTASEIKTNGKLQAGKIKKGNYYPKKINSKLKNMRGPCIQ